MKATTNMRRVCKAQMMKLVDLLSEEGVLINGRVVYLNTDKQNFWKRIAMQLNSVEGGVTKNSWKWCKMWADWKNKTKKKADVLLRRKNYDMDHPSPTLTSLEMRLLKLIDYPVDDKAEALKLQMVVNMEPEKTNNFQVEFLDTEYSDLQGPDKNSSDDAKDLDCYDRLETKYCDVDDVLQDEQLEGPESSDIEHRSSIKGKVFKKKKKSRERLVEEYKIRTKLKIEKDRVQQKSEELRLRALELKLKGEELRLKEIEMNKINYLTNIEEEKLKCFRDISSSLKELLDRTRTGNGRFQNVL